MLNTVDRDHLKASDGDIHICEPQAGLQHLFSHHVGHEWDWLIRSSSWRQWGHPAGKCRKLILKKCLQNVEIYSSNLDWLTTINVLSLCITPLIIAHETKKIILTWTELCLGAAQPQLQSVLHWLGENMGWWRSLGQSVCCVAWWTFHLQPEGQTH